MKNRSMFAYVSAFMTMFAVASCSADEEPAKTPGGDAGSTSNPRGRGGSTDGSTGGSVSSSGGTPSTETGGTSSTGETGGTSSTGGSSTTTGGTSSSAGTSSAGGGVSSGGTTGGGTDPNCNTTNAKKGATCSVDCQITCGFNQIGTKNCTCEGGVYSSCACPRPPAYMGAPTAPACGGDGMTASLKNTPCTKEWDQCIGSDPVTGTTPQGCACLKNPKMGDALTWACGSTNKWFALATP